ncbi:MAG: UDP-N-acetylmuramoyl-tripeptide--D-alanyl-D-alanine ligase [bacterium]|nr:UDP-N-acetylmuramoyl-tripeptide--D-alanyl-D-alanine ligase [bacterium]
MLMNIVAILCLSIGAVAASRVLLHYFQLESYQFPGYFRTLRRNALRALLPGCVMAVSCLSVMPLVWMVSHQTVWSFAALALIAPAVGALLHWLAVRVKMKKPLVLTPRMKRLYAVSLAVNILVFSAFSALCGMGTRLCCFLLPLALVLLPLLVAFSGLLAWPIEKVISEMYFRDAQRVLREHPDLIRIGITGSYGKTSVKFILGTLLSEKYQTLVTPGSFNTPMGVTKIIRTRLLPSHQVFVAEMGARHVGDIKEMCRLVHPKYGVLTSVGPQHLDTFKTLDRIKSTKYELMQAIPQDGCCFFPDDQAICSELYAKTAKTKRLSSLYAGHGADVWVENVKVFPGGSRFDLCTGEERQHCETRLLGDHNIANIALAASVCLTLNLTLKQIARGIAKLEPVEHRMQLIENAGGITIIDDAFNSNPSGAEKALAVLEQFPGRRIIITPGMVELGEREAEFNRGFGRAMKDKVDLAILVGRKHTQPIADGLREAGFDMNHVHQVGSLDEATQLMRSLGQSGDTVLFENDLPDHYSE